MKILKGVGQHTQKSVFECYLDDDQIDVLKNRMLKEINEQEDTIRLYILPRREVSQIEIIGYGVVYEEVQLVLF